jgi:glycosyltransferase involved in cell wall biosynthesis
VVESGALLRDLPEVQLVLIGDGVEYTGLVELAKERRLLNVRFLGRRPPEMMAKLYALADVLLVHLKPDVLSEVSIPSKTFAYMASGRPVLMAVQGEATRFVVENGFGIAAPPSSPHQLAAVVRRLHAMSPEERSRMGSAGCANYRAKYSAEVQVPRMEALLLRAVTAHQVTRSKPKVV